MCIRDSVNTVAASLPLGHEDHSTPLMSSIVRNSTHTVRALLEGNADLTMIPKRAGDSALHLAGRLGRADCLEVLLEEAWGADIYLRNEWAETPLETTLVHSVTQNHYRCAQMLRPREGAMLGAGHLACEQYADALHRLLGALLALLDGGAAEAAGSNPEEPLVLTILHLSLIHI